MKVSTATSTTAGTKYEETRSASFCTGARLRCASPTMRTICARSVSLPTRSARITNVPVPLTVPPVTRAPAIFSTGIGSPVTSDSSTELDPSVTIPSTGTFSPGRTRRTSPTAMCSTGTSISVPSARTSRAVFGESLSSDRIACGRAAARAQLQHLSQQDQRRDRRRRFEIYGYAAVRHAESGREEAGRQKRR